jgi:hypothetical protein
MEIIKNNTNIIDNNFDISILYKLKDYSANNDICYFDIETTGLSRKKNIIYLIGVAYPSNNYYETIQWFNDDGKSEEIIIKKFVDFIKKYKIVINYNGNAFDIPFVCERAKKYDINFDITSFQSLDLYKIVAKYKKFLGLSDAKQKTVELFLHITRTDEYDGGTLINIYYEYLKYRDENRHKLLLLHNSDDLCGLVKSTDILSYVDMISGNYDITNIYNDDKNIVINCKLHNTLKHPFYLSHKYFYISAEYDTLKFLIHIEQLVLKYFYDNYKDYFYLPDEDMAIHKSVALFVDRNHREKAKRENCYIKKEGLFVRQEDVIFNPSFKANYSDKYSYALVSDIINDKNLVKIKDYTQLIMKEATY